ncbi:MAG TPA: ATP-binding protein [Bacillota bacterium]|nr:ATP-binding protein [Bacillota bacterium]
MAVNKTSRRDMKKDLSVDELQILMEISRIVNSNLDLDEMLQTVHSYLPKLIPHKKSCLFFYQETTGKVTIQSNIGLSDRLIKFLTENLASDFLFKQQLKTKTGWRSTDIYTVEEIKKTQFFQNFLRREGILYSMGAPILIEGNFIGTVQVSRPESRQDFSARDLKMLELVANQIGIAVKNALTYEKGLKEKDLIINILEQKVKQAERLASLGRAAAIIAHEVKNPLTSMRLSLYSIEKKSSWKMDFHDDLEIIKEAMDRVSRTMEDLLHFSTDTNLMIKEVDINELLREVVSEFKKQHKDNLIIETSLNKPIPSVLADSEKMKGVFRNLIANAISATSNGGAIRVTSDHSFDRVFVTVEDWGSGIPPEIRQKIFEPFFTTKQSGTGLGLAIAKKDIEAHKGSIEVESEIGWGTKFTVTIPVYNSAAGCSHDSPNIAK